MSVDNTKEIQSVYKFPIITDEVYLKQKKINYLNYVILVYFSNFRNEFENMNEGFEDTYDVDRFIYENKILKNKEEIEKLSKTKLTTFIRNVKKLAEITNNSIVSVSRTKENKIVYNLIKSNQYVNIEEEILKVLCNFCSSNAIKTYCFLKWRLRSTGDILTRKEIAYSIGLSSKSNKQLDQITDITNGLQKLGLIKKQKTTRMSVTNNTEYQAENYYELIEYKDWLTFWNSEEINK